MSDEGGSKPPPDFAMVRAVEILAKIAERRLKQPNVPPWAASGDSSKVVVGKCDAGSITILRTSDDTPVLDMPAPLSAVTPPNGGNALPQNPVFVLAGP